jgi:trans-aconitate 2-methyltransferase
MSSLRDWEADSYDVVSKPLETIGVEVLDRLELAGDETVLDAGCGSGRVTQVLADRLPRGRVLAVDGSPAMVAKARERLKSRARVFTADLLTLALDAPVDAILSTATFHWIADHDRLFARLRANLVPGGRLVAQCGAAGNVDSVVRALEQVTTAAPYAEAFAGWPLPWNFATPAATADRLAGAGFTDVWTWRNHVEVRPEQPVEYFRTVMLGAHLDRLAPALRDPFLHDVMDACETPAAIPYVRLNILARA